MNSFFLELLFLQNQNYHLMTLNRLRLQQILVATIFFAGLLSMLTERKGFGTIYPSFHWKLYSQPLGTHHSFTEYRIYSKKNNEIAYHRNAVKELKGFSTDDYNYTFYYFVEKTLADSQKITNYKQRLFSFVKYAVPDANKYKVVAESYNPASLAINKRTYDTLTVINF